MVVVGLHEHHDSSQLSAPLLESLMITTWLQAVLLVTHTNVKHICHTQIYHQPMKD